MRPETLKLLFDVEQACSNIMQFTEGKTYEDYASDLLLRSAVERQFEIIGEALNTSRKKDPETIDRITGVQKIISFRNMLIHGYSMVDNETVWEIVKVHLPLLHRQVRELLEQDRDKD